MARFATGLLCKLDLYNNILCLVSSVSAVDSESCDFFSGINEQQAFCKPGTILCVAGLRGQPSNLAYPVLQPLGQLKGDRWAGQVNTPLPGYTHNTQYLPGRAGEHTATRLHTQYTIQDMTMQKCKCCCLGYG